ncbi:MAG: tetratricopeptide repeat protein, partial [Prevotella sp.]|nr:tetratricopeptide repeat protein [Prevotella sp.]
MTLLHEMAYICGASGDRQKAVTLYEEAYAFSRQFRNDSDETRDDNRNCESLWKAAEACEQLGYAREALRFYRQCYEEDKGGFLEADRFGGLEKLKHLAAALERLGA